MKIFLKIILFLGLAIGMIRPAWAEDKPQTPKPGDFIVLCYHDVPEDVHLDKFGVDQFTFINTVEYLRTHGYQFVSVDDILAAQKGTKPLPAKAVLLTFDDAYQSFYDFVFPVLKQYHYPCVLAVVSSWLNARPSYVEHPLMSWEQVKEVAASGLVEIASHTHDLHKSIDYNPQGNEAAAATSFRYVADKKIYEAEDLYRKRIQDDMAESKKELEAHLGKPVRLIVWPYGRYNALTLDEAKKAGFELSFSLNDHMANVNQKDVIERFLVYKNPALGDLLRHIQVYTPEIEFRRIMQVDLDLIYDDDPAQMEQNLSRLLDRVQEMKVNTIYLQAFADPKGDGNIASVYFPNRVLPMRADLFNRVSHQLHSRPEVEVYAWMPMLSIVLPDEERNNRLRVKKLVKGRISPTDFWYSNRLSPFSLQTRDLLSALYEDLARSSQIDGVVFQDDGYLNDFEDFSDDGSAAYKKISGSGDLDPAKLGSDKMDEWTDLKTATLIKLTEALKKSVLRYQPEAKFARTLYSSVLTDPQSEEWFAQNYDLSLKNYDYVVIMAYPRMDKIPHPVLRWFDRLVAAAKARPTGLEKTVFKIQTYDWERQHWIDPKEVNAWLRELTAAGAHHLAYYPDDYTVDEPRQSAIRLMLSTEDFPYKRE